VQKTWRIARRFEAAMQNQDFILVGMLAAVDGATAPSANSLPVGIVRGFCASEKMGQALMQRHDIDPADVLACFASDGTVVAKPRATSEGDIEDPAADLCSAFESWRDGCVGGGQRDLQLSKANVLEAQVLGSHGKVRTLMIDLSCCRWESAMALRAQFPRLSVKGHFGTCDQGFAEWMNLCEVEHLECKSNEEGMNEVPQAIRRLPSLRSISLDFEGGCTGPWVRHFYEALRSAPTVDSVGLIFQEIEEDALNFICALIQRAPSFKSFSLALTGIFSHNSVENLAKMLRHTEALRHIDFTLRGIGDKAWATLAEAIKYARGLQSIKLAFGDISDEAVKLLAETIFMLPPLQSISVALQVQCISNAAAQYMGHAIRSVSALHNVSLILNSISEDAVKDLAVSIRNAPALQSVNLTLGDQRRISAEAMGVLCEAIRHTTAAQSISLFYPGITPDVWDLLADAFKHAPLLQSIKLSIGALKEAAVAHLADVVRKAPALQSITFAVYVVSDELMEGLSDSIRHAPVLQSIDLTVGDVSDQARIFLAGAIRHAPGLKHVKLIFACGTISDDAMEVLTQAIQHAPALQELNVSFDHVFGDGAMTSLAQAVRRAPALEKLHLHFQGGFENSTHAVKLLGEALPNAPSLQSVVLQGLSPHQPLFNDIVKGNGSRCKIVFW